MNGKKLDEVHLLYPKKFVIILSALVGRIIIAGY